MKRSIMGALALALVLLSPASAQFWNRPLDRGGDLGARIKEINASVGLHRISGDCMSACTIWLGHKPVCIEADATLWFHSANSPQAAWHDPNPWHAMDRTGNTVLRGYYPSRLRAYVDRAGWLETPEFHEMSGDQAIALGIPACR